MNKDELRYSRLGDIIQIIISMKSNKRGMTLDDIALELDCTRRTAERVRDVLLRNFTQIVELKSTDRKKRWGFDEIYNRNIASAFVDFSKEELLQLELFIKESEQQGQNDRVTLLKNISNKITILKEQHYEENIKDLLVSEGYAIRQYPTQHIDNTLLRTIRDSLSLKRKIEAVYNNDTHKRELEPYGLLYHHKTYLIAKDNDKLKVFSLIKFKSIRLLDSTFEQDADFNLQEYAQQSFGIYQEEMLDIVLHFDENSEAEHYYFHPTQRIRKLKNGKIEVSFRAGGTREICWELFKWGTDVEVIKPQLLKDIYKDMLITYLENIN